MSSVLYVYNDAIASVVPSLLKTSDVMLVGYLHTEPVPLLLVNWTPNIYKSFRTTHSKHTVDVVKRNGIDRINLLNIIFFDT